MNARSSRCWPRPARLLLAASSALLLFGCATTDRLGGFSAGDAKLAVTLPQVCEAFLRPVAVPPVTPRTDARIAYRRTADALDDANGRLGAGGDCIRDQRVAYKAKEKPQ